jgi:hypothetical protein
MLARGRCLVAPGVFDLISTHILNQHAAEATDMTGLRIVASALGLPDAGLLPTPRCPTGRNASPNSPERPSSPIPIPATVAC